MLPTRSFSAYISEGGQLTGHQNAIEKEQGDDDEAEARELHLRFAASPGCFTFQFGDVSRFFAGLEGLIGSPSADILRGMEREHASDEPFSSHNVYDTTPRLEFDYVMSGRAGEIVGREAEATDHGKDGWRLRDFVAAPESRRASLLAEEVCGLRLYTGPMYVWYNGRVLRRQARGLYVTTIHAINSGTLKLARHTRACTVYRGVANGVLPDAFWTPNEHGVCGGIELGFMSTTTERRVALEYIHMQGEAYEASKRNIDISSDSGGSGSGIASPPVSGIAKMVFEIRMGMIDRGASVTYLSQFPTDREILFAPLTGLEVASAPRVEAGDIMVIPLRLSCNLHDQTIEQVVGKMKHTAISLIAQQRELLSAAQAPKACLARLDSEADALRRRDAGWFNTTANFQAAVTDALNAREAAYRLMPEEASWPRATADGDHARLAARVYACAELCAREQRPLAAARVLRLGILRRAPTSSSEPVREANREEHWRLEAAKELLSAGAPPPWSSVVVEVSKGVESRVGLLSKLPSGYRGEGSTVLAFEGAWTRARLLAPRSDGLYDAMARSGWRRLLGLPPRHVLTVSEDGPGLLLRTAAAEGQAALVSSLLAAGTSVFEADDQASTALHLAAANGHAAVCRTLLDAHADADVEDMRGRRASELAIQSGVAATWRVFLPSNSDKDVADAREEDGQVREAGVDALLEAAVGQGVLTESEMDTLTDRLALGSTTEDAIMADLHPRVKMLTRLMLVCRHGRVEAVRKLLSTAEGAASASAKSGRGTTALMVAAEGGFDEVVGALLPACGSHGPDERDRDGNSALILAASNGGSAACVVRLLEWRVDPAIRNQMGMAALHAAAKYGHSECLAHLLAADNSLPVDTRVSGIKTHLEKGSSANGSDDDDDGDDDEEEEDEEEEEEDDGELRGLTALMLACAYGHEQCALVLIESKASVDLQGSNDGRTALAISAQNGHDSCVSLLLRANASVVVQTESGSGALLLAAEYGHAKCLSALLESGARTSIADDADKHGTKQPKTPLAAAAANGYHECVELLLAKDLDACVPASPDAPMSGVLMEAVRHGHEPCVTLLVEAGADADERDEHGKTALMVAAEAGFEACMVRLLCTACDINAQVTQPSSAGDNDDASLRTDCSERQRRNDALLLNGWTALMLTAKNGHSACMHRLLARDADVTASMPSDGRTALLIAVENGHVTCVQSLLASCAVAHVDGKTALATLQDGSNIYHLACKSDGGEAMLDLLLTPNDKSIARLLHAEHQQTLETPNERGERPLHVAALAGRAAVVRRLLVAEANVDATDTRKWTPLMVACQVGSVETVRILLDAQADAFHYDSQGIAAPMLACVSAAQPADRQAIIALLRQRLHTPGALEVKGQTAVDPVCKKAAQCHVHANADDSDGTSSGAAYSALMTCADVATGANDCQLLQLLESEDAEEEAERYYVWRRSGRLGVLAAPHTDLRGPMPLVEAVKSFEEAFESVMGCHWEQRAACTEWRRAGAYMLLECDFSPRAAPESTLDPRTQELVKLITGEAAILGERAEEEEALAQAAALSFDPCGLFEMFEPYALSAASVERAGRALDEIVEVLKRSGSVQSTAETEDASGPSSHATSPDDDAAPRYDDAAPGDDTAPGDDAAAGEDAAPGEDTARLLIALSSRFYCQIPTIPTSEVSAVNPVVRGGGVASQALVGGRKVRVRAPLAPLPTIDCLEMVDALRLSCLHMHPLDLEYAQLRTRLTPLDREGEVFTMLKQYVLNTHAPTHSSYSVEVEDAFGVEREGEDAAFRDVGNKQLLFHGSRLGNWRGILSSGLRIAPPEAPCTGYMFGKGLYFADVSSKSINYAFASKSRPQALVLLCEVALGQPYELLSAEYSADVTCATKGLDSTHGLGKNVPLEKDARRVDGVKVPMGKLSPNPHPKVEGKSQLLYNEVIVYDTRQVKQRYLLSTRLHFKELEDW